MRLPAEPHLEFLARAELAQEIQDRAALFSRQPVDVRGEVAVDVERLALGHRMGAHDRMRRARIDLAGFLQPHQRIVAAIDVVAGMRRGQPFEIGLHARRQRVIGRVLAGEQRIAADRRHRVQIEDAGRRRLLVAGHIRVPVLAVDAPRFGVGVDRQDLGMPSGPGVLGWMCNSPKYAAEAACGRPSSIGWSRKNSTWCSASAWCSSSTWRLLSGSGERDAAAFGADASGVIGETSRIHSSMAMQTFRWWRRR